MKNSLRKTTTFLDAKMLKRSSLLLLLVMLLASIGNTLQAQGTTSSRITGVVTDEAGEILPGATIQATHTPTGFEYATVSNIEGLFTLNNVNVGGPYTIVVSYIGFEDETLNGVYLNLGQTLSLDIILKENVSELDEVVVTAGGLFDGNRTGAETKISLEDIEKVPTGDRGFADYLRLTPQANIGNAGATNSGGVSFAGINNRFNAIFIDGAVNNDVFGLANSGTNGGQAGISPISPDALEQIQVVLASYDVTLGGFAGGGINAVTRSGTNTFQGSAYFFNRNENLAGKTPTDNPNVTRTKLDPFSSKTYGFRLGGPIIKNKLHFFVNTEIQRDEIPRPFIAGDYNGNSTDILGDLEAIRNKFINDFGYDPGGFNDNPQTIDGEKFLVKLDWNINEKHKLSARHSYVKAQTQIQPTPNSNRVVFGNTGYIFPSTTNSTAIELKSNFSNTVSNNLIIGRTRVLDDRDILGDPFPQVQFNDGPATVIAGTDNFSFSNIVDQEVFTLTNNLSLYKGKHTITIGTHNELFSIKNLFTIFSTPRYLYFFDGINRFLNDEDPDLFLFGHEQADANGNIRVGDAADKLGPTFKALQMAFYAQDEFQITNDFKLTYGLRLDIPMFLDDAPLINTDFNTNTVNLIEQAGYDLKGAQAGITPKTQILWSPRIGFNWDAKGDNTTQIRGGLGVFTGRVPWVWPGGIFIRNGLNSGFNVGGGQPIFSDPQQWVDNLASNVTPGGDVDLFVEDFKYPQILRTSLAIDKDLGNGFNGTLEATYTKTLNNLDVKNVNIARDPISNGLPVLQGDDRAIFDLSDQIDGNYTDIILVDNTNEGYTFNLTAQLAKSWNNGFDANASYSFTRADALFDGRGFINGTNWDNILSSNGNNFPTVGRSTFDAASRITAFVRYQKEYANNFATGISLFYSGQSGQPYTYSYSAPFSDISNNAGYNDILYVPANQGDITFVPQTDGDGNVTATAEQQWQAFDAFINNNDYLSERRGDFVEQNRVRTPFEHVIDLKITQDFFIRSGQTKHNLQLSLDIFNFTNMLNKDWGRRYFVGGNVFPLLTTVIDNDTDELLGFQFNDPGDTFDIVQSGTYSARWNAQFGIRYSF